MFRKLLFVLLLGLIATGSNAQESSRRRLRVVMYPFIPEYKSVFFDVKTAFEHNYPDVQLSLIDLADNYYASGSPNYIGDTKADVYELDSVFLRDFVNSGKIQPLPAQALLPEDELLQNAAVGSRVGGIRYGAAHWVCGNFLFFAVGDKSIGTVKRLSEFEQAIGVRSHPQGQGLMADLKGKLTLGEFYLEAALEIGRQFRATSPQSMDF